jgi:hypothetical protein
VQQRLVIEGQITDEVPPYSIKLTYSGQFTSRPDLPENLVVNGAVVTISDDQGHSARLEQEPLTPAYYWMRDSTFRGQPGRAYTLRVQLPNGIVYVSDPEYMPAVAPVERLYARYIAAPDEGTQPPHFQIYLNTKDPDTLGNYYRWSSYAYLPRWSTGGDYCSCDLCWVPEYGPQGDVQSDALINGNLVVGRLVYDIPVQAIGRQYINVRQYALTRTAYQYWVLFSQQASRTGSLFDPQPAPIEGNVHRDNDPSALALGYFGASAVSQRRMVVSSADTINVKQFLFRYEKQFRLPGSCLRIYPQAQLTEPSAW